jgi:hypothetical protein
MEKNKAKLANIQKEIDQKKAILLATGTADESKTTKRKRPAEEDDMQEEMNPDATHKTTSYPQIKVEEDQALLEHALDELQGETSQGLTKSREEAERDRQKLLSGEGFDQGEDEMETGDSHRVEDDDEPGYGPDGARRLVVDAQPNQDYENNLISIAERENEVLRRSGLNIIPDDEKEVLGGNRVHPWRNLDTVQMAPVNIVLHTKFDVVELDVNGKVVDVGDDDFMPSLRWAGRRPGFEFKLGERGLGYYRTGRPVVVPSNLGY